MIMSGRYEQFQLHRTSSPYFNILKVDFVKLIGIYHYQDKVVHFDYVGYKHIAATIDSQPKN